MIKKSLLFIIIFSFLLVGAVFLYVKKTDSLTIYADCGKSNTFLIDEKYPETRSILIRTNAIKEIVRSNHGELISYDRKDGNFSLGKKPLKNWDIYSEALLKIQTSDKNQIPPQILTMRQEAWIDNNEMIVETNLIESTANIIAYRSETRFTPEGDKTRCKNTIYLKIAYKQIPLQRVKEIVQEETNNSVSQSLARTELTIKDIVSKYKGKFLIIPTVK